MCLLKIFYNRQKGGMEFVFSFHGSRIFQVTVTSRTNKEKIQSSTKKVEQDYISLFNCIKQSYIFEPLLNW